MVEPGRPDRPCRMTRTSPPYSKDPRTERSLRHSVRDGVASSVMAGAGETYLSAYALFLKASASQISWLTALPCLLGSLTQIASAWLSRQTGRRKPIILLGVLLQAFMWLPIIWLPSLFPQQAVPILIASVALYQTGASLAAPAWSSLMGDLVPARRRGRFFADRSRLMSLTTFFALAGAGLALHLFKASSSTRLGFSLVFAVAMLARLYSALQLARMHDPAPAATPAPAPSLQLRWQTSPFVRFTLFFAAMQCAAAIAAPFFSVYMLRDLHFSYLQYMVSLGLAVLAQFGTLRLWGRLGDIFGNRRILSLTAMIIPVFPLLWLLSPNFWYVLVLQLAGGLCWAGFSLSASNYLYDATAPAHRAACTAVHNLLANSAIFAGALCGGLLSTVAPDTIYLFGHPLRWTSSLWAVLLASTLLRALVSLISIPQLQEVRPVRPISAAGLMLRVARFNALSQALGASLTRARRYWRVALARA
jgi:MFS family permease